MHANGCCPQRGVEWIGQNQQTEVRALLLLYYFIFRQQDSVSFDLMALACRERPRPSPVTPTTIYEVGAILRLPSKDQIPGYLQSRTEIDDGCFDHPALIIWIDQGFTKATILIVSTSQGAYLPQ